MTHRTLRRLSTVVLAPAAALAIWAVARLIGVDLVVLGPDGSVRLGPVDVVAAALAGAVAGWAVVWLLERRLQRLLMWWPFIGSTALAVSIIGPTWLADGASAVALISMHVVTAAVVISGFAKTLPVHRGDCDSPCVTRWLGGNPAR
jgi:hypothetical protein